MMLVTLSEAKIHLKVDHDDEDSDITLKIQAASNAILKYLDNEGVIYEQATDSAGDLEYDSAGDPVWEEDSSGDYVPRYEVKAACLLMVGTLYLNREGVFPGTAPGYLPPAVLSLLYPLRDPVVG